MRQQVGGALPDSPPTTTVENASGHFSLSRREKHPLIGWPARERRWPVIEYKLLAYANRLLRAKHSRLSARGPNSRRNQSHPGDAPKVTVGGLNAPCPARCKFPDNGSSGCAPENGNRIIEKFMNMVGRGAGNNSTESFSRVDEIICTRQQQ